MNSHGNHPSGFDTARAVEPSNAPNPRFAHSWKAVNAEQAFFQLDLKRSLQLHRRLALSIAAVGLVLGIVYYFAMTPVYLAQCLVYVEPAPPSVLQQGVSSRWPYDATTYDTYIQQQIQNVMREDVLVSVLKKLGDAGKKPDESDQDALDRLRKQLDVARRLVRHISSRLEPVPRIRSLPRRRRMPLRPATSRARLTIKKQEMSSA